MNDVLGPEDHLATLIHLVCTDQASDDDRRRLNERLRGDLDACAVYRRYCEMHAELMLLISSREAFREFQTNFAALESPASIGESAAAQEFLAPLPPAPLGAPVPRAQLGRWPQLVSYLSQPLHFGLFFATVSTVALILFFAQIRMQGGRAMSKPSAPVARLTWPLTENVQSEENLTAAQKPKGLRVGEWMTIKSGGAKLQFASGADVELFAPASARIEAASSLYLKQGRLLAEAPSRAHGFVVTTPHAKVVDLGTCFEVVVDDQGHAEVHVRDGRVEFSSLRGSAPATQLGPGEAARILPNGAISTRFAADAARMQKLAATTWDAGRPALDLLSIVAGGRGDRWLRERGIDPETGEATAQFFGIERQPRGYCSVTWNPWIDGVFVPDASGEPVVINSSGQSFKGFSAPTGVGYGSIWARDALQLQAGEEGRRQDWVYLVENRRQPSLDGRGFLGLASNAGITFDLRAIRRQFPTWRPDRLTGWIRNEARFRNSKADVWIFLDERLVYHKAAVTPSTPLAPLDVTIDLDSNFLTLVTTENDDGVFGDWVAWGDLVLELARTKQSRFNP